MLLRNNEKFCELSSFYSGILKYRYFVWRHSGEKIQILACH